MEKTTDLIEKPQMEVVPVLKSAAVQAFELAQRIASAYSTATMVPELYQGNVGNCLIAANLADRWNADMFMVMQNVYVIHGKPGVEGKLVVGLINNCGLFERLEFEEDDKGCTAFAKEIKSGKILRGTKITWDMVKAEGWDKNKTNKKTGYTQKSKWNTMSQQMFRYRSASFFARVFCPEVLLGMQTKEELEDITDMAQGPDGAYESVKEKTKKKVDELKAKLSEKEEPGPKQDPIDPMAGAANEPDKRVGHQGGSTPQKGTDERVECKWGCGAMNKPGQGETRHENRCDKNPDNAAPETTSAEIENLKSNFPNIHPDLFACPTFQNLRDLLTSEKHRTVWAQRWGQRDIADEDNLKKAVQATMDEAKRRAENLQNHKTPGGEE